MQFLNLNFRPVKKLLKWFVKVKSRSKAKPERAKQIGVYSQRNRSICSQAKESPEKLIDVKQIGLLFLLFVISSEPE